MVIFSIERHGPLHCLQHMFWWKDKHILNESSVMNGTDYWRWISCFLLQHPTMHQERDTGGHCLDRCLEYPAAGYWSLSWPARYNEVSFGGIQPAFSTTRSRCFNMCIWNKTKPYSPFLIMVDKPSMINKSQDSIASRLINFNWQINCNWLSMTIFKVKYIKLTVIYATEFSKIAFQ